MSIGVCLLPILLQVEHNMTKADPVTPLAPEQVEVSPRPQYLAGALWMVASGLLFILVYICVRFLASDMSSAQAAFLRYCFGLVFLIPVFMKIRIKSIHRDSLKLYVMRGIVHGMAVILWFYAMARIPIAEVTAIGYTTPIYTALGAVLVLKERIHVRRMIAIAVGFIGMLIILRPGFVELKLGAVAQFFAAICFAGSFLFAKKLTARESSSEILAMMTICCTLFLLPAALIDWRAPTLAELAGLALVAVFATAGHYAVTQSIAKAPLTVTQPFAFLQLVWAVVFGYWLFDEVPDVWVFVGALVIIGSISYISHREAVSARVKPKSPTNPG